MPGYRRTFTLRTTNVSTRRPCVHVNPSRVYVNINYPYLVGLKGGGNPLQEREVGDVRQSHSSLARLAAQPPARLPFRGTLRGPGVQGLELLL